MLPHNQLIVQFLTIIEFIIQSGTVGGALVNRCHLKICFLTVEVDIDVPLQFDLPETFFISPDNWHDINTLYNEVWQDAWETLQARTNKR